MIFVQVWFSCSDIVVKLYELYNNSDLYLYLEKIQQTFMFLSLNPDLDQIYLIELIVFYH